jgi:ABC-type anion transport system duplicated permease subunit
VKPVRHRPDGVVRIGPRALPPGPDVCHTFFFTVVVVGQLLLFAGVVSVQLLAFVAVWAFAWEFAVLLYQARLSLTREPAVVYRLHEAARRAHRA